MKPAELGCVDPAWTVRIDADSRLERVAEALCSLADGRFGTRGAREEDGAGSVPLVLAAGVYHHDPGGGPALLPGPVWTGLEAAPPDGQDRRELDLHGGVLRRTWTTGDGAVVRSLRFSSLAHPVGRPAGGGPPGVLCAGPALLAPGNGIGFEEGRRGDIVWARTWSAGGAASPPPPASAPAATGPGWSACPSTWPTRTTP
jgi:hypothetical protein